MYLERPLLPLGKSQNITHPVIMLLFSQLQDLELVTFRLVPPINLSAVSREESDLASQNVG